MKKTMELVWEGKTYTIEKMRVSDSEPFFELQERLAAEDGALADKYKAARELLSLMKCPQEVLDDTAMDELQDLIVALQLAHFGLKKREGDTTPPAAGTQ